MQSKQQQQRQLTQLYLDVGQRHFHSYRCPTCGMLYARGTEAGEHGTPPLFPGCFLVHPALLKGQKLTARGFGIARWRRTDKLQAANAAPPAGACPPL